MFFTARLSKFTAALGFALSASFMTAQSANATIVQFQTVHGDFLVNLYDKTTPKTVENFLNYVNSPSKPYKNSIIHRSLPGFIIQGGGFKYDTKLPLLNIEQNAAVINEPVYANKRGTIAMAKLDKKIDSATNQWFFNLDDNSANLDSQNGGFTVFGEVIGNGMAILNVISELKTYDYSTPNDRTFSDLPLRNYMSDGSISDKQLVMILDIVVLDANIDTAANLTPAKTTYSLSKSSGGSINLATLSSLLLLACLGFLSRSRR